MRRIAGFLFALAFAASLTSAPVLAKHHNGNAMMMGNSGKHKCPHGKSWVKGYVKKNGQKVQGYCR